MVMLSQILVSDERSVIGHFKQLGLTDSDAIYAEKQVMLKMQKTGRTIAFVAAALVALPSLFSLLAIGGVISAVWVVGFWGGIDYLIYRKWKKHTKAIGFINAATASYCKEIGVAAA